MTATLLELMFEAPLVAISPRSPVILHAADQVAIARAWPDGTLVAECGATGLLLFYDALTDTVAPWPPKITGRSPFERCGPCWERTGRKRPRCTIQTIPEGRSK